MESSKIEPKLDAELRGLPKSGRWWKNIRKERHSAIVKVKPLKSSWKKKMQQKTDSIAVKTLQEEIRGKRKVEIEAKKEAELERKNRKEENQKKSEIVQLIKNTRKLKRVKKKMLRKIEKRDTN